MYKLTAISTAFLSQISLPPCPLSSHSCPLLPCTLSTLPPLHPCPCNAEWGDGGPGGSSGLEDGGPGGSSGLGDGGAGGSSRWKDGDAGGSSGR